MKVELVAAITSGEYDTDLDVIVGAISLRKQMLGQTLPAKPAEPVSRKSVYDFKVGEIVVFNDRVRPHYLQGREAKVVKRNRVKLGIELLQPTGRFYGVISCPLNIIDKKVTNVTNV